MNVNLEKLYLCDFLKIRHEAVIYLEHNKNEQNTYNNFILKKWRINKTSI
jgi:hypothetical protein